MFKSPTCTKRDIAMAERMARRWPEHAGEVYQHLLEALCEEKEKE